MKTKNQKTEKKTGRGDMTGKKAAPACHVVERIAWYEKQLTDCENEKKTLLKTIEELRRNIVEGDEGLTEELCKYRDALVLARSLINIPDNIADMVKELIKARTAYWDMLSSEIGWENETILPDVFKLG